MRSSSMRHLPFLSLVLCLSVLVAPVAVLAQSMDFGDSPTSAVVESGSADRNVVKVKATGPNNGSRIRYAISGHPAFSITPRGGRVMYDGSAIAADSLQLTVTVRDRRDKYEPASLTLHVEVRYPAAQAEQPAREEPAEQQQAASQRQQQPATAPVAPSGFSVRATRFDLIGFIAGAHLSWDNPNNAAITGWELRVWPALRAWGFWAWTPIPGSGPDTTSHVVTGLRYGWKHRFEVRAVVGEVKGAGSATRTIDLSHHKPTGLTATPIKGGVTLQWDDADSHAGIAITGWESSWAVVGNTPWEAVSGHTVADGKVTFTIDHESDNRLNPHIELETYFRIRAVYANGQRGALVSVAATPIAIPRPPPD